VCVHVVFYFSLSATHLCFVIGPVHALLGEAVWGRGGVHGRSEREMHNVTVSIQFNMFVCTSVGVSERMCM
jgi:hypothetical protein